MGNITQKKINTGAVSYVYDDKYRLTGYTNTNASPSSQSFTFDYRGNRLSLASTPGGATSYTVGDNNMVTAAGGESLQYDGRGNVTGRGSTQFEWDYKNRLVKADKEGVQEDLYYTYNNADRMLSRTKWNKKVTYYYNGNQLLCEKDEFGRLSKVFINDSEGLLGFTILNYKPNGEFSNYEPVYYLFNDQGSVTTLTNEVGRPIKHYLYDPYGNLTNTTTDPNNNFTFIGRYGGYKDWDSGLIQFQHRWYDSNLGRWMSRDPIGVRGGVNVYEYVGNRPNVFTDATGYYGTSDFVINYFTNADPVNLNEVGLIGKFRNNSNVKSSIVGFKDEVNYSCQARASIACGSSKGSDNSLHYSNFNYSSNDVTDVSSDVLGLYAIGHSTFYRNATCSLSYNCALRKFSYSCQGSFSIKDWFRDPLDVGAEIPGGNPYPINASWSENFSGGGNF